MNILHVIRNLSLNTGGPVVALKELAESQAALGAKVTVLTHASENEIIPSGVKLIRLNSVTNSWHWSSKFHAMLNTLRYDIDIIHGHMVWDYPILAAAQFASDAGLPFLLRACGNLDTWSMSQGRHKKLFYLNSIGRTLKTVTALHFTTRGEKEKSENVLGVKRSYIIPNGVSDGFFQASTWDHHLPNNPHFPYATFVGRLHPKKCPDLLMKAFSLVCNDFPDWRLIFAGTGDNSYLSYLKKLRGSLNLDERVIFAGLLNRDVTVHLLRGAEFLCLPSQQENFGIVVAEAMAAGIPTIVSDAVDLAIEVGESNSGIVTSRDPLELSRALLRLMACSDLRVSMGQNAKRFAMAHFCWSEIAQTTLNAYEDLVPVR